MIQYDMINWRRWLGLRCDQVERMLGRKTSPLDPALIQSLSAVDKKKIKSMLASDPVQNMPKYVRELEIMLAGNLLFFCTSHATPHCLYYASCCEHSYTTLYLSSPQVTPVRSVIAIHHI